MKDDVDRSYVPRQRGGCSLLPIEDVLHYKQLSLAKYLAGKEEPLLQAIYRESQWSRLQESPSKFKARTSDEYIRAWNNTPLDGQFIRELVDGVDLKQQWPWLLNSNLKKEAKGLVITAQTRPFPLIVRIKANIYHQDCLLSVSCTNVILKPLMIF